MIFHQNTRLPAGKMVGAIVLAAVLGMLLPLITLAQITLLLPVLMFGGLFAVYLQCYGGPAPACTFLAVGLISAGWLTGSTLMWMLLAASLLPAAPIVFGISRKQPFCEQLRNAIVFYALGLLAALLIAYGSFGSGMIAKLMDAIRSEFARMPDAAFRPFVDAINSALGASGLQGFGAFTVQTYRAQLSGVLDLMQRTYAQTLPGTLLSGVVLSGTLSVLWGNWTLARRGMSTNESFIGMSRWFLPARITVGALVMWVASYIIANTDYAGGATVYATVYRLVGTVFAIQGFAAADRRMMDAGRSVSGRRVLITLLAIAALLMQLVASVLSILGMISAVTGSHGALRLWLDKRRNNHTDDDDFDR